MIQRMLLVAAVVTDIHSKKTTADS